VTLVTFIVSNSCNGSNFDIKALTNCV